MSFSFIFSAAPYSEVKRDVLSDKAFPVRRKANGVVSDMLIRNREMDMEEFRRLFALNVPAGYSDYGEFLEGNYRYGKAMIKTVLFSDKENIRARISQLKCTIDVPDLTDGGKANVSSLGTKVFFKKNFSAAPIVNLTLKSGIYLATPVIEEVSNKYFMAKLVNPVGNQVDGFVEWEAHGY